MLVARGAFKIDMNTTALSEIHEEIERASEERTELWHRLSQGHDPALKTELAELNNRLDRLWDEHRALRARMRFGDREAIVARARVEERLERAA
jgi:predicted  nucleic acid-binding Zn-ribbon protein